MKIGILFLISLFNTMLSVAQSSYQTDSLSSLSYDELNKGYNKFIDVDSIVIKYGHAYLKKARLEKDTIKIANGFTQIANKSSIPERLLYCDSIIELTKNSYSKDYPGWAHITKGSILFHSGDYANALDNYTEAYKAALEMNNDKHIFYLNSEIGQLKTFWGDPNDAIKIYRNQKKLLSSNDELNSSKNQLSVIFSLTNAFIINKQLDSASKYNQIGLNLTLYNFNKRYYHLFLEQSGEILHRNGYYTQAKDSLIKTINSNYFNFNLENTYSLLAQNFLTRNDTINALNYFKKADSIVDATQDYTPDTKVIYDFLQDYYIRHGNRKYQMIYTQKLKKTDSILTRNYKVVNRRLVESFEIPKLLKENNIVTKNMEENPYFSKSTVIILSLTSVSFIILFISYIYRKKLKKEQEDPLKDISTEVVKTILKKLNDFEENKGFIKTKLTLSDVAKNLNTNSTYLSKVVNAKKRKTFNTYLTDLRIQNGIKELNTNTALHKYDIKSLATEFGFNNSGSFSRAFEKKTGTKPSYYIKRIAS